ncbi:MAG: M48 family metallopeptidase [Proteobacteria bacterium]|nr:M48 family metallopeptidase [Pseudomonadota bacterium]
MALAAVGLKTAIWNNNIRSILLLALYPALISGLVWAVAALATVMTGADGRMPPAAAVTASANAVVIAYWPLILSVVGIWFVIAFFFHTKMVRNLSHSRPVTRLEEPELYNLLENLCISRGLPMPRLEIMETDALNAFASGIGRESYAITVTRGLMKVLRKDELEAVLGHELTHIMNNDVRLLIISVIFTGMIGFAMQMVWSGFRHSLFYGRHRSGGGNRRGSGQLMIFIVAVGILLWIGYTATLLTRFALSRRREFMADAGSVELTTNPEAMMRALLRISGRDRLKDAPDDIALMCIENTHRFLGVFATHPPIERRIAEISRLSGVPAPDFPTESRKNPWH